MLFVGCLLVFCLRFSVVLFCGGLFDCCCCAMLAGVVC